MGGWGQRLTPCTYGKDSRGSFEVCWGPQAALASSLRLRRSNEALALLHSTLLDALLCPCQALLSQATTLSWSAGHARTRSLPSTPSLSSLTSAHRAAHPALPMFLLTPSSKLTAVAMDRALRSGPRACPAPSALGRVRGGGEGGLPGSVALSLHQTLP